MSTKTSMKRIALIAVSALGFGLLAAAPSSAAQSGPALTAVNALGATANTLTTGSAQAVFVGGTLADADEYLNTETLVFAAALTTYPSNGYVAMEGQTAGASLQFTGAAATDTGSGSTVTLAATANATTNGVEKVTATGTDGLAKFEFTPSVAGDYVVTIWNDVNDNGALDLTEARFTVSMTVAAAAAPNTTPSATYSAITAWDATAYSRTAGTDAGTAETVTIENTADAPLNGQTVRALVSGPGTVKLTNAAAQTVTGRDVSLALAANENTVSLLLEADGTSGSTTVDIYAGTTKIITTAAISWYGTLATLKVVQNKTVVTKNVALTGAVTISGLDADGNFVPLADNTVVGTSSDTTVLATKVDGNDSVTAGVLTVSVTGANDVTTTSGRTASISWKYLISGTTYTPSVVSNFSIGGAVAAIAITFDKATYAPGEKVTATVSATDSSGNAAGDSTVFAALTDAGSGALLPTLSSNVPAQGITTAAISTVGGKATTTFYAPAVSGSFLVTGSATIAGTATTITSSSATVVSAGEEAANAATDAAAEAIDAANAATDAANLAAEAADAATVAAEEARDAADAATAAVEELATQVATLMAALKAQITTLANTVAKIAKKVKA